MHLDNTIDDLVVPAVVDKIPLHFVGSNDTAMEIPIFLKRLLQHYAVYTNQPQTSMSYLLRLLKTHKPEPAYDDLPSSGQQLMAINGYDVPDMSLLSLISRFR